MSIRAQPTLTGVVCYGVRALVKAVLIYQFGAAPSALCLYIGQGSSTLFALFNIFINPLAQMFGRKYFEYINGNISPAGDNLPREDGELSLPSHPSRAVKPGPILSTSGG